MSNIKSITMDPAGPALVVKAAIEAYPVPMAANLWQYTKDQVFEKKPGVFTPGVPTVTLDPPPQVTGRFFLLEGAVIALTDGLTSPYAVVINVRQGDKVLFEGPPTTGGSGQISDTDIPFNFRFALA
jgi:hypothetical protein